MTNAIVRCLSSNTEAYPDLPKGEAFLCERFDLSSLALFNAALAQSSLIAFAHHEGNWCAKLGRYRQIRHAAKNKLRDLFSLDALCGPSSKSGDTVLRGELANRFSRDAKLFTHISERNTLRNEAQSLLVVIARLASRVSAHAQAPAVAEWEEGVGEGVGCA